MNYLVILSICALALLLGFTLRLARRAALDARDLTWGINPRAADRRDGLLDVLAQRAGWNLSGTELGLAWLTLSASSCALAAASGAAPLVTLGVGAATSLAAGTALWMAVRDSDSELEPQFGEAMALIAADVRSGASVSSSLSAVMSSCNEPLRSHLERVMRRVGNGSTTGEALWHMARATGSVDVQILATVVKVQESHGGSIAGLVDQIGETVADRQELRRLVRARSASMTMTVRIVTGAVALFVVVGAVALEQGRDFYSRPIGLAAIAVIAFLLVLANVITAKLKDTVM